MNKDKGKARKSLSTDKMLDRAANQSAANLKISADKAYATSMRLRSLKNNISPKQRVDLITQANKFDPVESTPPSLKTK